LVHVLCLNFVELALRHLAPGRVGLVWSIIKLSGAVAASIGVAYILYRTVEQPLIEVGRRWSKRLLGQERKTALGSLAPAPGDVPGIAEREF
jgi:peptidoglycan/LPS O-acetylase OafA/YrhL